VTKKADKAPPDYQVDDPQEAWKRFEALAQKAMTTTKTLPTKNMGKQVEESNEATNAG
jgi:hypothetical protein